MIEFLAICLIIWTIYLWKAGKFSKDSQAKEHAELNENWQKFKVNLKTIFNSKNQISTPNKVLPITTSFKGEKGSSPIPAGYRYILEYQDRFANDSIRYINILSAHKEYGNNRWYFEAECALSGNDERTFKSERVVSLTDTWTGRIYNSSTLVRNHLKSEHYFNDELS